MSVLSTGLLTIFSVKREMPLHIFREATKPPTKNVGRRLGTKNSFLNAYAWRMICASSFARPQNERRDHSLALFGVWLFYVKWLEELTLMI